MSVPEGARREPLVQRIDQPPGHLDLALAGGAARLGHVELLSTAPEASVDFFRDVRAAAPTVG